jgi:hypothetical protein
MFINESKWGFNNFDLIPHTFRWVMLSLLYFHCYCLMRCTNGSSDDRECVLVEAHYERLVHTVCRQQSICHILYFFGKRALLTEVTNKIQSQKCYTIILIYVNKSRRSSGEYTPTVRVELIIFKNLQVRVHSLIHFYLEQCFHFIFLPF